LGKINQIALLWSFKLKNSFSGKNHERNSAESLNAKASAIKHWLFRFDNFEIRFKPQAPM
jgi:hypothetical protein